MRSLNLLKTSLEIHLFINICSAPNISGTSVNTAEPPQEMTLSATFPIVGFAVIPLKPSLPPHLSPIVSLFKETSSLLSFLASEAHFFNNPKP